MALVDDFKSRFPEFDVTTADTYVPILEPVIGCYYGGAYDTGCGLEIVLNLLAHLLTIESSGTDASVRDRTSVSVGNVSESFAQGASMTERAAWLGSTKYGQRFLFLTQSRQGGVFV